MQPTRLTQPVMFRPLAVLMLLASASPAQGPGGAGEPHDLVVIGGTPGGVACAVRAARQGLRVLLVNRSQHLGGMVSGGIGVNDTQYEGSRAPILDEFNRRVLDHYRTTYGENSPQYEAARPGPRELSGDRLTYEPHIGEKVVNEMVAAERGITVLKGYYPVSVERAERMITAVRLAPFTGAGEIRWAAGKVFVDATYEADLAALAGVEYRVGREDRNEYGEPHAGRIFSVRRNEPGGRGAYPHAAVAKQLDLRPFTAVNQQVFAGSTGEGDAKVQAYNYRLCLTRDPANRRVTERPARYDREVFVRRYGAAFPRIGGNPLPNNKANWWQNPSGENDDYPRADWTRRREIERLHHDFALGLLYFLQNDDAVPAEARKEAQQWGLAKDEFTDNDNFPYEMYVREARRIVGRHVFTEHDASLARGYQRTPVHGDSIAIGEWFMDSHEVSKERQPGSDPEGMILLSEITRPSQIPYRALLPKDLDNLLVPVCLSATHVGWGTIRLEPTWMHTSEAAGFAAALAVRQRTTPGELRSDELQRQLVESGVMVAFFNDFDMSSKASWRAPVQYLATKGFFADYNARPGEPLTTELAREWARLAGELLAGRGNPDLGARAVSTLTRTAAPSEPVQAEQFVSMLEAALAYWGRQPDHQVRSALRQASLPASGALSRGQACELIYRVVGGKGR